MIADLFVMLFLITMVLFIVYHFYIDYKNWSNTGNTFAEGFSASQERLTGKGADYRGKQNKTKGGFTCQNWSKDDTHTRYHTIKKAYTNKQNGVGNHNFCRNPTGKHKGIWCYTTNKNKRWDDCEPLKPPQPQLQASRWNTVRGEGLTGKGADYRGKQNKTVSGRTCQKWTLQAPHKHSRTPQNSKFKNKGLGDHNFCRNPDGEASIWCYTTDPKKRWELCEPLKPQQRNFAQIMQVNRQVQEQQMRNALNSGIDLEKAAGVDPQTRLPWKRSPPGGAMPRNIAEYVIGEIISGRLDPPPQGSPWANLLRRSAPEAYQRIGSTNPLQQQAGVVNSQDSQAKWSQMGRAMLMMLRSKIVSGEMPPPPQGSDWEQQLRTVGPIPPYKPHPSGRPAPTPQQVMMIYGLFTSQISRDLGQKIKRGEIPPPSPGSFWDNKLKASGEIVNTAQNQLFNQRFDRQMAVGQLQSQALQPGQSLQGVPSSQPAASKMQNTAIFNEQLMKQVLSNKLLIPSDVKLSQENQGNFIRVGKNFMKDLSHIRNVAIPNIDNDDYESLGRVVAKIKIQEQENITGPQNIVAKQKLINSVNNILSGTALSNSQVNWESPQHSTTLRTTGMYGDNSNSMMGYGDKASKPDGGLCMWKGCEKHPKRKPYDSVWSLY